MTLSENILRQRLARPFQYRQRVDSTNNLAKSWLQQGAPDGAVVVADEQLRGRGRKGRFWHTPPKVALAVSVILKPAATYVERINMIGALSVFDLAELVGCEVVGIKWPNDVQVHGKKLSGILVESVWERHRLIGVVLGIGVNVRNDFSGTALHDTAISLEHAIGEQLDRAELVHELLDRIDHWYRKIATDEVFETWKGRLNMLGNRVTVAGSIGYALDVTAKGTLLIEDDMAGLREVNAGDIFTLTNVRSAE